MGCYIENELWEFKVFIDVLNIVLLYREKNILEIGLKWFVNG